MSDQTMEAWVADWFGPEDDMREGTAQQRLYAKAREVDARIAELEAEIAELKRVPDGGAMDRAVAAEAKVTMLTEAADALARATLALNRAVYALGDGPHLEAINVLAEVEFAAFKHGQYIEVRDALRRAAEPAGEDA